jgi:hypothetical protein
MYILIFTYCHKIDGKLKINKINDLVIVFVRCILMFHRLLMDLITGKSVLLGAKGKINYV